MFKNTFQSGFLSILYSIGSKPLQIWDKQGEAGMQQRAIGCLNRADFDMSFPRAGWGIRGRAAEATGLRGLWGALADG